MSAAATVGRSRGAGEPSPPPGAPRIRPAAAPAPLLAVTLLGILAAAGCGSRGGPLPPYDPVPPPVQQVTVAQRGYDAVVRFEEPRDEIREGRDTMALERIEILVRRELYPVITGELLVEVLEDELDRRVEGAREAIEAARDAVEGTDEAAGAEEPEEGGEAADDAEEAGDASTADEEDDELPSPDARLGEAERIRQRIPDDTRERWRAAGVGNEALLATGRQLQSAVEELWEAVGLPETIVDPERPPGLPDRERILSASRKIAGALDYERVMTANELVGAADEILTIDMDEAEQYRLGRVSGERPRLGISYPVGLPGEAELQTRLFFGCRTVSARGREGRIGRVASLVPVVVLLPPARPEAEVLEGGVRLTWRAPFADARGVVLIGERPLFNVYRGKDDGLPSPEPLNRAPLETTTYVDRTAAWETGYVYSVRALRPGHEGSGSPGSGRTGDGPRRDSRAGGTSPGPGGPGGAIREEAVIPVKESAGARTGTVRVVDTFSPEPPGDLRGDRAGAQVTLRWTASGSADLVGYRIYRHPLPAPDVGTATDDGDPGGAEEAVAGEEAIPGVGKAAPDGEEADGPAEAAQEGVAAAEERPDDPYLAAGWRALVESPVSETRYVDGDVEAGTGYAYLVVAVDRAGNASDPARAEVAAAEGGP